MKLDWKEPFSYMFQDPGWKGKIFAGGLWLFLFPPLGWPIALGYRKEALLTLIDSRTSLLPPWEGQWIRYLMEGLKAVGVILVYFLPFLFTFWFLAISHVLTLQKHALEVIIFIVATPLLLPICLPFLPPLYWYLFPWIELSLLEMVVLGIIFWGTTFFMPAAFLQVSLNSRFLAAFRVDRVLVFVASNIREYIEAWLISILATAIAFALGPAFFWGIFWSYLVIVYAFNETLFRCVTPEVQTRFRNSYFVSKKLAAGR